MSKMLPTSYDSSVNSELPNLEPEKRVGGGEFVKPTVDLEELTEDTGIVSKAIDTLGIKPLKEHKEAAAARRAMKATVRSGSEAPNALNGVPILTPAPISPYNKVPGGVEQVRSSLASAGVDSPLLDENIFSLENNPLLKKIKPKVLKDALTDVDDNINFDKDAIDKIAKSLGLTSLKGTMSDLDFGTLGDSMSEYMDLAKESGIGDAFGFAGHLVDGVGEFSDIELGTSSGILDLLDDITGNQDIFDYTDFGGEASFLHSLIEKAIEWDIPGYIDKLTGLFHETKTAQLSIERNLKLSASLNNYDRWKELYKKLDSDRKVKLKKTNIVDLMRGFTIKKDEVSDDKIVEMLSCVSDVESNWNVSPSGKPYIYYYSYASVSALDAMFSIEEHKMLSMVGRVSRVKASHNIRNYTLPITSWQ